MKSSSIFTLALTIAIFSMLAGAGFQSGIGRGQSPGQPKPSPSEPDSKSRVKPTVLLTDRHGPADNGNSLTALDLAASRNDFLRNELVWTFGGKEQHGWYLYTALIKNLLGTEESPASPGFAAALAAWQKKSGLNGTGVLDEDSLYAMVAQWQAVRIKDRTPAQSEQLVTVPATEFYDPERLEERRQVERETYAAYHRLIAAAMAEPSLHLAHDATGALTSEEKFLKIISAFRTREYQEQLRRQSPNAGSAGLAINSPHFTGRALDLYVGGDPVDSGDVDTVGPFAHQRLARDLEQDTGIFRRCGL